MQPQKVWAVYFSGTGTTKKVTAAIADELTEIKISQDKTAADENPGSIKAGIKPWQRAADIDFTPPAARREIYRFTPDDLVVFGVPYMALIANAYLGKGLTFWQVIKNGMLIYLPGDLLKIALGSFLCVAITRRLPQVFAAA